VGGTRSLWAAHATRLRIKKCLPVVSLDASQRPLPVEVMCVGVGGPFFFLPSFLSLP